MLIPSISVGTRRLHDTGRSGWWMWLLLIPYIGWLVLFIFFVINSEWGSNQYGDNPKGMANNATNLAKLLSTSDNDKSGLMPEDFGKPLDEALFFEWKESVKKLNKLWLIQVGLYAIGIVPGILYGIIVTKKLGKKILNLQMRLGITNDNIKQAKINCKLAPIAQESLHSDARIEAIQKLTNQTVLANIAKNDKNYYIRNAAASNLTNETLKQEVYTDISKNAESEYLRICSVNKMTNKAMLSYISENDKSHEVRFAAVRRKCLIDPEASKKDLCKYGLHEWVLTRTEHDRNSYDRDIYTNYYECKYCGKTKIN